MCKKDIYRRRACRKVFSRAGNRSAAGQLGGKPLSSLVFLATGNVGRETVRTHRSYGCHRPCNQYLNFKPV